MTKLANRPEAADSVDERMASRNQLTDDGFAFGEWVAQPSRLTLRSHSTVRRVDPQTMAVLVQLASRAGRVVRREELFESLWRDTVVSPNSLAQAVSRLRRALGDDWQRPRYIETISKTGYRLIPPLQPIPSDPSAPTAPPRRRRPAALAAVTLLSVFAGLAVTTTTGGRTDSPIPAPLRAPIPVLALEGTELRPLLSPSGGEIAFAYRRDAESDWDVFVRDIVSGRSRAIANTGADEVYPAWSASGTELAFAREDAAGCGLYRVSARGGAPRRLGECFSETRDLTWSPDGTTLVFSAATDGGSHRLFRHDLDTRETSRLGIDDIGEGDTFAMFSPDGDHLAFRRRLSTTRHALMLARPDGSELRSVHADDWGRLGGVDWLPDGSRLVFASNRSGRFSLWTLEVGSSSPPVAVPVYDEWMYSPSVSRDGRRLLYTTYSDVVDAWTVALDAAGIADGEPRRTLSSTRSELLPRLAPDGARTAVASNRGGTYELWWSGSDAEPRRLTHLGGPEPASPMWSPDGRTIVFSAAPQGQADLYLASIDSNDARRLTGGPGDEVNPSFSADGRFIYYATNRHGPWSLWKLPIAGGAPRAVATHGFHAQEDPDGRFLYYLRTDGERPGLWRRSLDSGETARFADAPPMPDWANWLVRRRGIYYVDRSTSPPTIRRTRSDGGSDVVLRPSKPIPVYGRMFSVSRDESRLVFSMIDRSVDEVMQVDWE